MNNCCRIYWLPAAHGWLVSHLVGGGDSCFIQAMAETTDYTIHVQASVRSEAHFKQHFAFQFQAACFIGVNRIRLESDFHRRRCATEIGLRNLRAAVRHLLRSKSAGCHALSIAASVTLAAGRDAIAEIRTGHRSLDALCPARSVALSRADRHIESARRRCNQLRVGLAFTLQSVGIAKATRLNFVHRRIHRRLLRTATEVARVY